MSRPIGLYAHVPLCRRKCGYCDFYSVPVDSADVGGLLDAMGVELDGVLDKFAPTVRTVFVGGGTPTALDLGQLSWLLQRLGSVPAGRGIREFTVEANPETADPERLAILAANGVDRISIGAQSFEPAELAVLQRGHRPGDVARAVELARAVGIHNVSLDLIFGISGQTVASWRRTLDHALSLGPEHLSCYGLTYEPGTPLTQKRACGEVTPVDEEIEAEQYDTAGEVLRQAGFERYEISNYAIPGRRCTHNTIYWDNREYLGIGPSAASYMAGCRWKNVADIDEYQRRIRRAGHAIETHEKLGRRARAGEAAMLALRTAAGIAPRDFRERYGYDPFDLFAETIAVLETNGLVSADPERIGLTESGWLLADHVAARFLAAAEEGRP